MTPSSRTTKVSRAARWPTATPRRRCSTSSSEDRSAAVRRLARSPRRKTALLRSRTRSEARPSTMASTRRRAHLLQRRAASTDISACSGKICGARGRPCPVPCVERSLFMAIADDLADWAMSRNGGWEANPWAWLPIDCRMCVAYEGVETLVTAKSRTAYLEDDFCYSFDKLLCATDNQGPVPVREGRLHAGAKARDSSPLVVAQRGRSFKIWVRHWRRERRPCCSNRVLLTRWLPLLHSGRSSGRHPAAALRWRTRAGRALLSRPCQSTRSLPRMDDRRRQQRARSRL